MKDKLFVESLLGIFTIDKSNVKILLEKKKTEPYKGYWSLPNDVLKENQTLEDSISDIAFFKFGFKNLYLEQSHTFSAIDRKSDTRTLGVSYLGLVDMVTLTYNANIKENIETYWFNVDELPKMAFDHENIIKSLLENFKSKIININFLKVLFPSDFTLPELQVVYEYALDKKLDRRNFRKKLINLGVIEDTNLTNDGSAGRPAKLYRLKEEIDNKNIF